MTVDGTPLELWKDYAPLPPIEGVPVAESGALNQVPVVYAGRMGDSVAVLSADDAKGKIVVLGPAMDPTGKEVFNLSMGSIVRYQGAAAIAMANWDLAPPGIADFLRQSGSEMKEGSDDPAAARPLAIFVTRAAAERCWAVRSRVCNRAPPASPSTARLPLPKLSPRRRREM